MRKQLLGLHNSDGDLIDSNDNWMDNLGQMQGDPERYRRYNRLGLVETV